MLPLALLAVLLSSPLRAAPPLPAHARPVSPRPDGAPAPPAMLRPELRPEAAPPAAVRPALAAKAASPADARPALPADAAPLAAARPALPAAASSPAAASPALMPRAPGGPAVLTAIGYAPISTQPAASDEERRLLAIRAAQIAALRNLAEQIHGVRLQGATSIAASTVQSDQVRASVTGIVAGARTVRITPKATDVYEIVVEIERDAALQVPQVPR